MRRLTDISMGSVSILPPTYSCYSVLVSDTFLLEATYRLSDTFLGEAIGNLICIVIYNSSMKIRVNKQSLTGKLK